MVNLQSRPEVEYWNFFHLTTAQDGSAILKIILWGQIDFRSTSQLGKN